MYHNVAVNDADSRANEAVLRTRGCDVQLCGRISWKQQHTRNLRLSTRTRTTSNTCPIPHWSTCSGRWHHSQQGWYSIHGVCKTALHYSV